MSSDRFRHVVDLLRRLLMCTFEDMHSGRSGDMHPPSLGIYGELGEIYLGVSNFALSSVFFGI